MELYEVLAGHVTTLRQTVDNPYKPAAAPNPELAGRWEVHELHPAQSYEPGAADKLGTRKGVLRQVSVRNSASCPLLHTPLPSSSPLYEPGRGGPQITMV